MCAGFETVWKSVPQTNLSVRFHGPPAMYVCVYATHEARWWSL